ncbi:MAG: hypothetical protein FWD35_03330 [Oscillospiraceae bacterium]|nr:hypothetical protein [Oscillospiraceae bacterium]
MDTFIEQLVTKKPDTRAQFAKAGLIILAALMCLFCFLAMILTGVALTLLIIPGILWVANYYVRSMHTEYEYILTNQELDIDKITGKAKRKRMITLNLKNAESFGAYSPENSTAVDVTVAAHDNSLVGLFCLVVNHEAYGKVNLLFNPDERFIDKLVGVLPAKTRAKN